ncbi:hypothetical protein Huta_1953 [Halorhabdus utahensis DSM 12940]|uniref:Uncharacterized protein n=1 Tax=Halorhabdus utahensis (strain DSM 12940 / JCM 11049 / AX-2) TaxID=519442 RepID=C7NT46_HALUD|nr:hypothetical protein [Halorhabdus utahensis]ACV12121.1 hypothetical protein Huta_1953 [Halorhabdus utahensis DSM 12940]
MSKTPVEENFVTRIILGLVVIYAMMIVGGAVGGSMSSVNRYAVWLGFVVGAIFVFGIFTVAYYQYSQSYDSE